MSRFCFCNCPAGFSAEPERHAPDCPGRSGAGKARTPVPATTPAVKVTAAEELDTVLHWRTKHAQAIKERDGLQISLNTADQSIDELNAAISRRTHRVRELEALLTAADERADVLEGLLREAVKTPWLYDVRGKIMAALKPAEAARCTNCDRATVEQCDDAGCGFLGAGNGAPY